MKKEENPNIQKKMKTSEKSQIITVNLRFNIANRYIFRLDSNLTYKNSNVLDYNNTFCLDSNLRYTVILN